MDIAKMFRACKVGDIETVKNLVETKDVDINFRDKFDSTPLYYACLCGHLNLVRFLLEQGAKIDVKTFDGERCVYGALTDDIRKLLLQEYKVLSKKVIKRNDYDEFLRKSLERGEYSDVMFEIHGTVFKAHRFILMARSQYFHKMLLGKWRDKPVIYIKKDLDPEAFKTLLYYLYTGVLEFSLKLYAQVLRLFRNCQIQEVVNLLQSMDEIKNKSRNKNITIFMEYAVSKDYYQVFLNTLPEQLKKMDEENLKMTKFPPVGRDVFFNVGNNLFQCHKLFLAGRSEYFSAMFRDHFFESGLGSKNEIPVFNLSDKAELFSLLLCFIYTNSVEMTLDQAFELLYLSDIYLLQSLKSYCSSFIGQNIQNINPVDIINLARLYHLPKLEAIATQHIAANLKQYLNQEDFKQLVLSDAQSIRQREETDSIDIIDDIRYYLSILSTKRNIQADLIAIGELLESLGLEA